MCEMETINEWDHWHNNILEEKTSEHKGIALETPQNETQEKRESNMKIQWYVNEWLWLCFSETLFT